MSQSINLRYFAQDRLKSVGTQSTNKNLANKNSEIAQFFEFMLILTEFFEIVI